uniref:Uncharacterized protein n=1 Tax=Klebsiella pneumoniae TaxID=573 RepID=A0A8B0SSL4_KLEPN|nr:hypothetical protein [Klebsiella pneumoniae]
MYTLISQLEKEEAGSGSYDLAAVIPYFRRIPPLRLHTLTCFEKNMSRHIDVIAKICSSYGI